MPEEIQSFKEVRSVLDPLAVDKGAKAAAFDAYFDAPDVEDFKKRFDKINLPKEAKASLWDLKFGKEHGARKELSEAATPSGMGRLATAELPAIGATIGGVTMGPAGAFAGGAVGTAAKRAIQTRKGEAPVPTAGEFATDVGLGGAEQLAYEVIPRGIVRGAGKLARGAAKPLYRSALSFTSAEDLPARHAATEAGLRLRVPVSEKSGLPKAEAFIQSMTDKVNAEIAKAKAAGKMVDTETILAPVREQVQEYAKSLAPSKPYEAAREIERDIVMRLGGSEVNLAGAGGKVTKRLVPGPRFMDPVEAQEAKRATSRTLRKAYGEEKGPAIETLKAGERGAKGAIEDIAAVRDPNQQEHVAITLKDAIERTLRSKPGWLKTAVPEILGAGVLTGIGHTGMAESLVVAGLVRQALQKPEVMSRLAIALNNAGAKLPKIIEPTLKYGLRFGVPLTEPMPPSRLDQNQR